MSQNMDKILISTQNLPEGGLNAHAMFDMTVFAPQYQTNMIGSIIFNLSMEY